MRPYLEHLTKDSASKLIHETLTLQDMRRRAQERIVDRNFRSAMRKLFPEGNPE